MKYNRRFVTPNEMHEFQRFGDTALMPDPEAIAYRAYLAGLNEGGQTYTKEEIDALLTQKVSRTDVEPILDPLPDDYTIDDVKRRQDTLLDLMHDGAPTP